MEKGKKKKKKKTKNRTTWAKLNMYENWKTQKKPGSDALKPDTSGLD